MDSIQLKRIDLSKLCGTEDDPHGKNNHPDIKIGKMYLAKIFGHFYLGKFSKVWYGFSFNEWGTSGIQLDSIDEVWEILSFPGDEIKRPNVAKVELHIPANMPKMDALLFYISNRIVTINEHDTMLFIFAHGPARDRFLLGIKHLSKQLKLDIIRQEAYLIRFQLGKYQKSIYAVDGSKRIYTTCSILCSFLYIDNELEKSAIEEFKTSLFPVLASTYGEYMEA